VCAYVCMCARVCARAGVTGAGACTRARVCGVSEGGCDVGSVVTTSTSNTPGACVDGGTKEGRGGGGGERERERERGGGHLRNPMLCTSSTSSPIGVGNLVVSCSSSPD
jgi:hypothetical protein